VFILRVVTLEYRYSTVLYTSYIFKNIVFISNFLTRDAPDIRPDNPAFFDIRYPAGYQIALPDIR
jgi:hypothetical protein